MYLVYDQSARTFIMLTIFNDVLAFGSLDVHGVTTESNVLYPLMYLVLVVAVPQVVLIIPV